MEYSLQDLKRSHSSGGREFGGSVCGAAGGGRLEEVVAAGHGDAAGAGHFENAERAENFEEAVDVVDGAGNFHNEGFGSDIDDASAENFYELHQVRTGLLVGGDF